MEIMLFCLYGVHCTPEVSFLPSFMSDYLLVVRAIIFHMLFDFLQSFGFFRDIFAEGVYHVPFVVNQALCTC